MRKILAFLAGMVFLLPAASGHTSSVLPDNMYFRAMQDEMRRTLKELRAEGSPKPYYAAYKLRREQSFSRSASLGKMYPHDKSGLDLLKAFVVLGVGSDRNDQLGFRNNTYHYAPSVYTRVPQSYEGIRRVLWEAGDREYQIASDTYLKKQAYKRQKSLNTSLPDVIPAPQAVYFEEIPETVFPEEARVRRLLEKLSAKGKNIPYLENFTVHLWLVHYTDYYLNSRGGAYQISHPEGEISFSAGLRNQDNYLQSAREKIRVNDWENLDEEGLERQADAFLDKLAAMHRAKKGSTYLGPVLLAPAAASDFMLRQFVWNAANVKPLLSEQDDNDSSAGDFGDKEGMRVISATVDVFDRPNLREYQGEMLAGFMPVDDEGVGSQDLALTSAGRLQELPRTSRPFGKGRLSNGHARMFAFAYPRETLTNVLVKPKVPLSPEELKAAFLTKCRDWGLEYCYKVDTFSDNYETNRVWRVYAEDGREEPVFGLDLRNLSARSLRDITAAGDDLRVFNFDQQTQSVVTPSLLLEEAEILPVNKQPDKPPFVVKP